MTSYGDGGVGAAGMQYLTDVVSWDNGHLTNLNWAFTAEPIPHLTAVPSTLPSTVTNISGLFAITSAFNQDISGWDISNVTNTVNMFYASSSFNQPLNSWNTSNVKNSSFMFAGASAFNRPLNAWNVSNVTAMINMFNSSGLSTSNYSSTLVGWAAQTVQPNVSLGAGTIHYNSNVQSSRNVLTNAPNNWTITDGGAYVPPSITLVFNVTDANGQVALPLRGFTGTVNVDWGDQTTDNFTVQGTTAPHTYTNTGSYTVTITGQVTSYGDRNSSFAGSQYLTDVVSWDNGYLTDLTYALTNYQTSLPNLTAVPSTLPSTVTNVIGLFWNATAFNQDISGWDTSNVTGMQYMFRGTSVYNQPLNSWNTVNVKDMESMFANTSAFNQPLNSWNVSNVTMLYSMFNASAYNQPLNSWNTANVKNMGSMFSYAYSFNQPLNSWNTSNVTYMRNLFTVASAFNQPLNSWNISNVTEMSGMFDSSALSTSNYSSTLVGWAAQSVQSNVTLTAGTIQYYSNAQSSRDVLTNAPNNWTITDGGVAGDEPITCFKRGTKILCLVDGEEKYIPVESIRNETRVKTFQNGYVKIHQIGRSDLMNLGTNERIKDRLYKITSNAYPELFEDLYLTGAHSLLVDEIQRKTYNQIMEIFGHLLMTDGKLRLMAYLDDKCEPYNDASKFEIWHFSLEHDDPFVNYGVYANGLLVETASIRWMQDYSGMEFVKE